MSAADWMVLRTRDGYRSVPRRVGLGMISRGQAHAAPADTAADFSAEPPEPHNDEYRQPEPAAQYLNDDFYDMSIRPAPVVTPTLEHVDEAPDADVPTVDAVPLPDPPRGNAARKEWAAYAAEHLGIEVTDAMNRNEIRDAAQEQLQSLARLPQPALMGGRLETPEDEPVTGRSVTDDEDTGTR